MSFSSGLVLFFLVLFGFLGLVLGVQWILEKAHKPSDRVLDSVRRCLWARRADAFEIHRLEWPDAVLWELRAVVRGRSWLLSRRRCKSFVDDELLRLTRAKEGPVSSVVERVEVQASRGSKGSLAVVSEERAGLSLCKEENTP